jgi:serine/threonine-protein kinase RsbW
MTLSLSLNIANRRGEMDSAEAKVLDLLDRLNYPASSRHAVRLALHEAITNAFQHGHKGLPPDEPVLLEIRADERQLEMSIEDRGPGFNPVSVPDPTLEENLEVPTGRGLLLIRAYMTDVSFNARGNRMTMTYKVPAAASSNG